ncbi:MAG: 3'(2'),5'-bisphosphate nucleotidase CysQ [Acidimicrobiales bacterium]|nr:3'(2'),5'-bisphosphate nucleotidase CysQ [Acidimicrobiales bacterium]MDG1846114.1 3'(2'),5'-bisphosphate nucleotidase CysQ [Acidimicrobiales bacterium]
MNDHELAGYLADLAGKTLLELRSSELDKGTNPWMLRDQGDKVSHNLLVDALLQFRPNDHVLSEEGTDNWARLEADRVWIIDPLDGSQDFPYAESVEWAVHVALIESGEVKAGAVTCPSLGRHYVTGAGMKAGPRQNQELLVVSNRWNTHQIAAVAERMGAELTSCGSAGVKASLVIGGDVDVYIHGSGLYEWDVCAPVAVSRAAGLLAFQLDGSEFEFNKQSPVVRGLVITRPELSESVHAALNL